MSTAVSPSAADLAGAVLTIDLAAIVANFHQLRDRCAPAECAAVVKADAYGLGVAAVVPALAAAGCRTFFVAQLAEGMAARAALNADGPTSGSGNGSVVYVLNGAPRGAEGEYSRHRLRPVLNTIDDVDAWAAYGRRTGTAWPAALHLDTGMSRLGLTADETAAVEADAERLAAAGLSLVMSHLACADVAGHPMNDAQLAAFEAARRAFTGVPTSLANSSGIFLRRDLYGDVVRPGAALYGIAPQPHIANPMRPVVRLAGRILQVRDVPSGSTVGYGATFTAAGATRIATVAVGYADGYLRALGNRGGAFLNGRRIPLVGRVSMDLTTFDVSGLPAEQVRPGVMVDLIGPENPVDRVAAEANTIGYEILTALGKRYHRVYLPGNR